MDSLKILILSILQGSTELLPVSSSGHILLLGDFMNFPVSTTFLTILHIGTTLSILFFFRDILFSKFLSKKNRELLLKILAGALPAALVGLLFEEYISNTLRAPWIISISLILWGIVMIVVERTKKKNKLDMSNISVKNAFLIGLSQAIALIPGTSRSGITTLTAIMLGIEKYSALTFSFLLGIPVLLGSSVWGLISQSKFDQGNYLLTPQVIFPVISITFLVGYISLLILKKIQKKNWLTIFGIYRIILGIFLILLQYWP